MHVYADSEDDDSLIASRLVSSCWCCILCQCQI